MEALANSCSKAIVQSLGSVSPRVAFRNSNRPEVCFSLRSRNDDKGCNFWLLKLVQNKGIYPLHAVQPKLLVDLEIGEPQSQESEETNEPTFVHVAFQLRKKCDFGEQFLIVGDHPLLGSWHPSAALPMTWSDGHLWTVELDIPAGKLIQFKFILKGKWGDIIWQPGLDRVIHTCETVNRITVCEDWLNAKLQEVIEEPRVDQLQKIVEEDELNQSNEKPHIDLEGLIVADILDNPQERLESNVFEMPSVEDIQTHEEEKPLAEPVLEQITGDDVSSSTEKPLSIIAENIGPPEDLIKSTSHEKNESDIIQQSEESAESVGNDDIIHDLGHNGSAVLFKNEERTIVDGSLFDFEGGPVLVPGLIPPTVPTDEAGRGEVQEVTTVDTSVVAFETQDQQIPEFSKEQESDDGTPQEINVTINNEPELLSNEHEAQSHLSPELEDRPNYQLVDEHPLQNDVKWGQETVKKFLTKLGFL